MWTPTRRGVLGSVGAAVGLAEAREATAQTRRILVVASHSDVQSLDPHVATGAPQTFALRNLYDGLLRITGNPPQLMPGLAESWSASADGREYVFKLNPRATFDDGSPVDAEAVRYSFLRALRFPRGNGWMIQGILNASSVEAVDPRTVRIRLIAPFAPFLQVLPWIWVVNPRVVEANKGTNDAQTWLQRNAAGSGPFRMKRFETGNLWEFERRTDDWHEGGGNLTGVICKVMREAATQRLAIQRGEIHIAIDVPSDDVAALKNRPGVDVIMERDYRTFQIKMNSKHGPLADINLRKAVSHAFNYQGLLEAAGYAELMRGPLPEGMMGFDPDLEVYRTDLDKARAYLARSGVPNGGIKLTMTHVSGLEQTRRAGLVLLDSLRQLNIQLDIKPVLWPDFAASTAKPETTPDFFPIYQSAQYNDPDNLAFAGFHSSRMGTWTNPVYSNPAVDEVLTRARSETDPEVRRRLYGEFQKLVVADAPDIFGILELRKIGVRSNVQNFVLSPIVGSSFELLPLSLG